MITPLCKLSRMTESVVLVFVKNGSYEPLGQKANRLPSERISLVTFFPPEIWRGTDKSESQRRDPEPLFPGLAVSCGTLPLRFKSSSCP